MHWIKYIGVLIVAFTSGLLTMAFYLWPPLDDPYSTPLIQTQRQFSYISQALRLYRLDFGDYPQENVGLSELLNKSKNSHGYLSNVPHDYWGKEYKYILVSGHPLILSDSSIEKYGFSFAYWVGNDEN